MGLICIMPLLTVVCRVETFLYVILLFLSRCLVLSCTTHILIQKKKYNQKHFKTLLDLHECLND